MPEIDVSVYVRAPQLDVPGAVALGVSLLSAVPGDSPTQVKGAAKKLRTSVLALQTAWRAQVPSGPPPNKRAADSATDNAWGCLEARLAAYARLPAGKYPKAPRAQEIHSALFGGGLDFLTLPYKTQWAEGQTRLDLIEERGFAADIDALAGPEFLAEVKATHEVYGEILGVTKPAEAPVEASLVEPLREVGRKVVAYSLQLVAWASDAPKAEEKVRSALKPLDEQRAALARRRGEAGGGSEEPEATPGTPVPEVPG